MGSTAFFTGAPEIPEAMLSDMVDKYARRYLAYGYQHESQESFAEQVSLDLGIPSIKGKVISRIRQMRATGRVAA